MGSVGVRLPRCHCEECHDEAIQWKEGVFNWIATQLVQLAMTDKQTRSG